MRQRQGPNAGHAVTGHEFSALVNPCVRTDVGEDGRAAVDLIRRAASCGRETPIEVVSRIGFGVGTLYLGLRRPALRLGS